MTDYATKIARLLAKAASTTHEAERDAFTAKAERLMAKWGIDDLMLGEAGRRDKARRAVQIEQRRYVVDGTHGPLLAELVAARVAAGVGPVRTLISRGRPCWWAVGYTDDLARVESYVPHIIEQARDAWEAYKRTVYVNRAMRLAFFTAFGWSVRQRLADIFTEATAAEAAAELVLAGRRDDVWAHDVGQVRTARPRTSWHDHAGSAGAQAGREALLSAGAVAR